jgi:DNA-binding transcriptional MerR regulator
MGDQQIPQQLTKTFTPAEVASLVGVPVHSIRRWCEYHKEHLSPYATPEPGQARRLTRRDVEVLRTVKTLRAENLTGSVINERLRDFIFGEIDNSSNIPPSTALTLEGSYAVQESPQQAPGAIVAVEALQSVVAPLVALQQAQQAQIEALQRHQVERSYRALIVPVVVAFAAGVVVTVVIILIILVVNR